MTPTLMPGEPHFGESVAVRQAECMNDGAPECLISCTFSAGGPLGEY